TVLALVASDGTIAVSYTYDSWGNVLSVSGDQAVAAANRFTWQGREYSYATGLYNFRARWYDPAAGRWLSKDPIGLEGGLNLYEAFGNNPVCFGDSIGCSTVHIHTSGSVITLVDPTMNDFRMAISQQDDNSIMELEILGHGSHNMINIEPGENGAGLIWEPSVTGDSVWMSDKGDKFSDLIRDKLAQNAMIDLNGCNTGRICKWVKNIWYIKRFYVEKKHSTTIERGIM
ncbi:MAG: RHS repeat-associated core domain-containing protein, partial [Kiritimatiellae bacterium]|nr:RHS repeat-associated core domain-containing protein [Kiritimatiellia bacterium]